VTLPDPARLLPLERPALLLDRLVEADEGALRALGTVPPDSPFCTGDHVPVHVAVEVAAQAAGAHGRLRDGSTGPPPGRGYLVLLTDVRFPAERFAAGRALDVRVELDGVAPPLGLYRFTVDEEGGARLASGSLGVYVPSS
jgi:predicted hotdog family 3-hydroxylacyl-ACP dehydratase